MNAKFGSTRHWLLAVCTLGLPTIAGCTADAGEEGEEPEASETSSALTLTPEQGPLNQAVERSNVCPSPYAIVGFGGRVVNDNLTDLTVRCIRINDNGSLSQETGFSVGGQSQEVKVRVPDGAIAYAFGVTATNDNVNAVMLKWCRWFPAEHRLNLNDCGETATPSGRSSFERGLTVRTRSAMGGTISDYEAERRVLVGLGFGVRDDNVSSVALWYADL